MFDDLVAVRDIVEQMTTALKTNVPGNLKHAASYRGIDFHSDQLSGLTLLAERLGVKPVSPGIIGISVSSSVTDGYPSKSYELLDLLDAAITRLGA
jgi:hypothetical protein